MIELYSANHLVLEDDREVSLDVDRLCRDVREAGVAVGMQDPWLAEQIGFALEDYFFTRGGAGETGCPRREEIDRLVARLLLAAGYGDVAGEFARRRQLLPGDTAATTSRPWNDARVRDLLGRHFALPGEFLANAVSRTLEKLADLAFPQVGDALIRELAAEVLREPPAPLPTARTSPWLFLPTDWSRVFTGEVKRFCRASVIRPHPVSRLLPAARLTLDLARLAAGLGNVPLTELEFWPALQRATQASRRALVLMRDQIRRQAHIADGTPMRVLLAGTPALTGVYLAPLTRAAARHLVLQIVRAVQHDIEPGLEAPLLVSFERGG